jgi:hypothetical protein
MVFQLWQHRRQYVGQKPTRACVFCVVLLFKYAGYLTRMLRKCTASTVEHFHTCQIGKMPLLGELKIYAMMDLSYTINTRSTCYVSSIGLRNLILFTQVKSIFNLYFTYQFIIWKWFSSFDNTVGSMSVKSPLGLVFFVLCCYLNMQAINKTFLILS